MQQRIDTKEKTARYAFDSLREITDYIAATPETWTYRNSHENDADQSWDLGAGWKGALNMSRHGWLEGAKRTQDTLKVFRPNASVMATRNDFYGYRPNVPRYIAGAPDNMIRHATQETPAPALTIIVPVCANAGTGAEHMANLGVGLVQLIRQMESSGTRCEVYGAFTAEISGWRVTSSWLIKRANQPLDLAVLAFAIGHPAMLRRLCLALIERCPARETSSYGQASNTLVEDCVNLPPRAIVVNGMQDANNIAKTPEAALEYLRGAVADAAKGLKITVEGI